MLTAPRLIGTSRSSGTLFLKHKGLLTRGAEAEALGRKSSFGTRVSVRMSSSNITKLVEHIVLFKVKPEVAPEKSEAMIGALRALKSLDSIVSMAAGPSLDTTTARGSLFFTHALHSRYKSKEDLATYSVHPSHMDVVKTRVLPIIEDMLALDWEGETAVADMAMPSKEGYGGVRILLLKPKAEAPEEQVSEALERLRSYKERFPFVGEVSVGKNFSPARAKGFEWGFVALCPSAKELDELTKAEEEARMHPLMEDVIVMDFNASALVPSLL